MNRTQLWRAVYLCVFFLLSSSGLLASTPVDLSPNSLNLGSQAVTTTSGAGSVSLTNHLSTPLSISGISTVGDFAQTNNCPLSLEPGRSCTIKVTFTPTAVGVRSGQLIVTDSDSTSPQSVSLSGTGTAAGLSSIVILPSNPTVPAGRQRQFTAVGYFKNGNIADLTTSVVWTSSNLTLATISNSPGTQGLATALKQGVTTITATLGSVAGATTFTVAPPVLVSLSVSPQDASVSAGKTLQFVAVGAFSDGTSQILTSSVLWSSSNPSIASVSNSSGTQGSALGIKQGLSTIAATLGSVSASAVLTVGPPVLASIAVSPQNASVEIGKTLQFSAVGTFSDGTTQVLTTSVTWNSSNSSVAAISNSPHGPQGLAMGLQGGFAVITASLNGVTGSSNLAVTAILKSIAISPQSPSLTIGGTLQFVATGVYADGTTQNLTTSVTWLSSDSSVATISNSPGSQGLATALKAGPTHIAATFNSLVGQAGLTVVPPVSLTSITISPQNPITFPGKMLQLSATGNYSDGSTQDLTSAVVWFSSSPTIASISNTGLATGVALGTATISAASYPTPHGVYGYATLIVQTPQIDSLSIVQSNPTIQIADRVPLTAMAHFNDGSTQDVTSQVGWASSDTSIALVSNSFATRGVVTGRNVGSSTITATAKLPSSFVFTASTSVAVTYQAPTSISVTPASLSIPSGDAQQFFAIVTFADGNSVDWTPFVIWNSSDPSVAIADSQGRVASVGPGTTAVSASLGSITGSAVLNVVPPVAGQARFAYVNNLGDSSISAYRIDAVTGLLVLSATVDLGPGIYPFSVASDPMHKYLYSANPNSSSISGFAINQAAGALSPLSGSPFPSEIPWDLAVHPSGKFLYVANGPGNVLTYSLDDAGALTYVDRTPAVSGGVTSVAVAPLGNFVYAANVNANTISFYKVDATSGILAPVGQVSTGANPGSLTLDSSGKFLFAPNENGQSVGVYSIDLAGGTPSQVSGSPFATGQIPYDVVLHPSGNFVYVVNQASNSISAFTLNSDGVLSPIPGSPFTTPGGSGPVAASVDPLGKWLYVVNQSSNNISIFAIDGTSGALTSVGSVPTGSNSTSIVLTQ